MQFYVNGTVFTLKGTPSKKVQVLELQPSRKIMENAAQLCYLQVREISNEQLVPHQFNAFEECDELQKLKAEFKDIFDDLVDMPPSRGVFDHRIPLLPNATPVNIRPYRAKGTLLSKRI